MESNIDYGGAKGSNTGDVFHELWAVRKAMLLLDSKSKLAAISVEGIPSADGSESVWDGVDCTLLYGSEDLETAERVEFQQLKYSAANPKVKWTVAKVSAGKNKSPQGSLIHRLGAVYKGYVKKRKGKAQQDFSISLVTNRPICSKLINIIEDSKHNVPTSYRSKWKQGDSDLHRLVNASGLSPSQFKKFAGTLNFKGTVGSRFDNEDRMLSLLADWSEAEFRETALRLRHYIRQRMMPEAGNETITSQKVYNQFGGTDKRSIFPAPNKIRKVDAPVVRSSSKTVASMLIEGKQKICLHGIGGVGKTTAIQEVSGLLPSNSLVIVYDCYGAGSYLDASALRHTPKDAFIQIANEMAAELQLPMILESNSQTDFARTFFKRLCKASEALMIKDPDALLVVAIDAADNAITAAKLQVPPEKCFVNQIVTFENLPKNVRILISARTGRLEEIPLSSEFEFMPLVPFNSNETKENVIRYWKAGDDWIEEFHHFSNGLPRVQSYAFDQVGEQPKLAINPLKPNGQSLNTIFDSQFKLAIKKSGHEDLIDNIFSALITLPRPIPIVELAAILQLSSSIIADICADLSPGVQMNEGRLSFADEDFEEFVRSKAGASKQNILDIASKRLLERCNIDEYAAVNVVPILKQAKQGKELLDFIEQQPSPPEELIADPVRRQEIQNKRLMSAIKVCRNADDTAKALRFILIGAESLGTHEAIKELLIAFPLLATKFAPESVSRLIFTDLSILPSHGPLLFQAKLEAAKRNDKIEVKEIDRKLDSWFEARIDAYNIEHDKYERASAWPIPKEAVSAHLATRLKVDGVQEAIANFYKVRPRNLGYSAGLSLISTLIAKRKHKIINAIVAKLPGWMEFFVLVQLAKSGSSIDINRMEASLSLYLGKFKFGPTVVGDYMRQNSLGTYVIDQVLTAAELISSSKGRTKVVDQAISEFLKPEHRKAYDISYSNTPLIDAIFRAYHLRVYNSDDGLESVGDQAFIIDKPINETQEEKERLRRKQNTYQRYLEKLIKGVTSYYDTRARLICSDRLKPQDRKSIDDLPTSFGWEFDRTAGANSLRQTISKNSAILLGCNFAGTRVLDKSFEIVGKHWRNASDVEYLVKLFSALPSLEDRLLAILNGKVNEIYNLREAAGEKSKNIASLAELLVPINEDDAKAAFQMAVEIATELDSEVMDQIKLIEKLSMHFKNNFGTDRLDSASMLSEVINDAGIRLEDVNHFPWEQAFSALTTLSFTTALACASRWDDSDLVSKLVRRHINCHRFKPGLRETLLTSLFDIKRQLCGIASVDVR